MDLEGNPGALMRFALLHLTNAIAKEGMASNLHTVRKGAHLDDRDAELFEVIELCRASMTRPKKRQPKKQQPKRRLEKRGMS